MFKKIKIKIKTLRKLKFYHLNPMFKKIKIQKETKSNNKTT